MASAFGHAALAGSLTGSLYPHQGRRFWGAAIACSILPDLDAVGFDYGIRYGSFLGHRGFTHSLIFAFLAALVAVRWVFPDRKIFSRQWWVPALFFFAVTASHGFLDAMTSGGLGVAFFSPFVLTRYFFPWRPIQVSPIGIFDFFSTESLAVLKSEFFWIGLPSAILLAVSWIVRRLKSAIRNPQSEIPSGSRE